MEMSELLGLNTIDDEHPNDLDSDPDSSEPELEDAEHPEDHDRASNKFTPETYGSPRPTASDSSSSLSGSDGQSMTFEEAINNDTQDMSAPADTPAQSSKAIESSRSTFKDPSGFIKSQSPASGVSGL